MFKNLPSSEGTKRGLFTGKTATVSLILHGLLLGGAVYATVGMGVEQEQEEELVEFMEIEEEVVEEEEPEPEPEEEAPPPPPPAATATLEPPESPPPAIPEVDLSAPAVSAEDFSGIGVLDAPPAPPPPPAAPPPPPADFAYELAVLDRVPALSNAGTVSSVMERLYPRLLQDAGIGGTVVMQFVIEPNGEVDMSSVKVLESSHEQFSEASIKAVERFRFRPGQYKGENVRVLIQMPITWQPAG